MLHSERRSCVSWASTSLSSTRSTLIIWHPRYRVNPWVRFLVP